MRYACDYVLVEMTGGRYPKLLGYRSPTTTPFPRGYETEEEARLRCQAVIDSYWLRYPRRKTGPVFAVFKREGSTS